MCVVAGGCDGAQAQPKGANPHLRSGAEAGRTPCPRSSGPEELPHVQGQGQRPRVPGCDSAGAAKRSFPESKVRGCGWEELPPPEARGGGSEKIPLVQGKSPRLHFTGAAMKRYPTSKVRETQVRQ